MNKVKAFTIAEMIVIMMLTAITVSAAFALYRIVAFQWNNYQLTTKHIYSALSFERYLTQDIQFCDEVVYQDHSLTCSWPDKQVRYSFEDSVVIRTGSLVDTFPIGLHQVEVYWQNQPVMNVASSIDRIHLIAMPGEDTLEYTIQKQYASDILFRKNSMSHGH